MTTPSSLGVAPVGTCPTGAPRYATNVDAMLAAAEATARSLRPGPHGPPARHRRCGGCGGYHVAT